MRSYIELIDLALDGDTPKQKYEFLQSIIDENSRCKGRIDFCKNQFEIIKNISDPAVADIIDSIIEVLKTPI